MTDAKRRWLRRLCLMAMLVSVVTVIASCGGDDDEPSSGGSGGDGSAAQADEAKSLLAKAEGPVEWSAPGTPIDVGSQLDGKTVHYILAGINLPYWQNILSGMRPALRRAGVKLVVRDTQGSVSEAGKAIDQAIGQKASAIVIGSHTTDQITAAVKSAGEAGIPVMQQYERDPSPPTPEEEEAGVVAHTSTCYSCAGEVVAQFVVADSGGKANAVAFNPPGAGVAKTETDAFVAEVKRLCPDCKTRVVEAPFAEWETRLGDQTRTAIIRDPSVNYLFAIYDGMVTYMIPAVHAAGAADRVKIVAFNATLPAMTALKDQDVVAADAGQSTQWAGYATADALFRLLLDEEVNPDLQIPTRIFTRENVASIDLSEPEGKWYGPDFAAEFNSLWGF